MLGTELPKDFNNENQTLIKVPYTIITDGEILEAIKNKEIDIEPFSKECLQPASYDMRLGDSAILSRTKSLEQLKKEVRNDEAKEINLTKEGSVVGYLDNARKLREFPKYVKEKIVLYIGRKITPKIEERTGLAIEWTSPITTWTSAIWGMGSAESIFYGIAAGGVQLASGLVIYIHGGRRAVDTKPS